MAFIRSVIRGVGAYLPKRIMTNDDLARLVDTSDAWIRERTGIEQRHIAEEGELTSDLGIAASRQALVRAGIDPVDIDLVVCATSTPDRTFPATARAHPGRARHHQGRRLRRAGGVLGLRLRAGHRRQFPQDRTIQARHRGRRRDLLAHPRLEGSRHLRAVRRRRRRGRAGGADAARQPRGSRHPRHPHPLGRPLRGPALRRRRARARPRPPATCA